MDITIRIDSIAEIILPMLETITWEDWQHMDEGTPNALEEKRRDEVSNFARMASMMLAKIPFDGERDGERRVYIVWDSDNGLPVGVRVLGKLYTYDFRALRNRYCDQHPGAERPLPPPKQETEPGDLGALMQKMFPYMFQDDESEEP